MKEHDVVADMEAVKNIVVFSLSNKARHLEAYFSNRECNPARFRL